MATAVDIDCHFDLVITAEEHPFGRGWTASRRRRRSSPTVSSVSSLPPRPIRSPPDLDPEQRDQFLGETIAACFARIADPTTR
jgi:hypothetical protein